MGERDGGCHNTTWRTLVPGDVVAQAGHCMRGRHAEEGPGPAAQQSWGPRTPALIVCDGADELAKGDWASGCGWAAADVAAETVGPGDTRHRTSNPQRARALSSGRRDSGHAGPSPSPPSPGHSRGERTRIGCAGESAGRCRAAGAVVRQATALSDHIMNGGTGTIAAAHPERAQRCPQMERRGALEPTVSFEGRVGNVRDMAR